MQIVKRDPRGQGDKGEMSAILWFMAQGAAVFLPIGHSPHFDLIADWGERLKRVQVKASTCFVNGRWDVTSAPEVATRAGAGWSSTWIPPTTTTFSCSSEMDDAGWFPLQMLEEPVA